MVIEPLALGKSAWLPAFGIPISGWPGTCSLSSPHWKGSSGVLEREDRIALVRERSACGDAGDSSGTSHERPT